MKRIAFGPLSLMPAQFWKLTLVEFNELVEGYKFRNRLEWERTAQLGAWVMQPHSKQALTIEKLIGKRDGDKVKITPSKEVQKEQLEGLFNELE